jgi:hypothetical protein
VNDFYTCALSALQEVIEIYTFKQDWESLNSAISNKDLAAMCKKHVNFAAVSAGVDLKNNLRRSVFLVTGAGR